MARFQQQRGGECGGAQAFGTSAMENAEIKFRWLRLCLQANWEEKYSAVVAFATAQGRMKYVRPLYRELHGAQNGEALAKATFLANRGIYHAIAATMIAKDLRLD